jgi:hypothetical protein
MSEVKKVDATEGFGENVRSIARRVDAKDSGVAIFDMLTDFVKFYANVFDSRVPDLVLRESKSSVIVAVYGRGRAGVYMEPRE